MPTQAELENDAKHLDYEIWMFMETADRFLRQRELPSEPVLRRALYESCLLHFRALMEFFRSDKSHTDDLRAIDYIDDPGHKRAIANLAPDKSELARANDLHKTLAHVVSGRDRWNTNWSEADLKVVAGKLNSFFVLLPPPRRHWFPAASEWFKSAVPEMKAPGSA